MFFSDISNIIVVVFLMCCRKTNDRSIPSTIGFYVGKHSCLCYFCRWCNFGKVQVHLLIYHRISIVPQDFNICK